MDECQGRSHTKCAYKYHGVSILKYRRQIVAQAERRLVARRFGNWHGRRRTALQMGIRRYLGWLMSEGQQPL